MIPEDKVLIVTGEPRSGTSLMMQTLVKLGVDVAGEERPMNERQKVLLQKLEESEEEKELLERMERAKLMNPRGFYEVPGIVARGMRGPLIKEFMGKALKVITQGIPNTDMRKVYKVILCIRNPKNVAVSQKQLMGGPVKMVSEDPDRWIYLQEAINPSPLRYLQGTGSFIVWLSDNEEWLSRILVVDYEDMIKKSTEQIEKIVTFTGIVSTEEQKAEAVANIDSELQRSKEFKEWSEEHKEAGNLAMVMYDSLKILDVVESSALLRERQAEYILEEISWVDDSEFETWLLIRALLWRSLQSNNLNVRTKLQASRKVKERAKTLSYICNHYSRNGQDYTINRPLDIGALTRKKVTCSRDDDEKTVEECVTCWRRGWHGAPPERTIEG